MWPWSLLRRLKTTIADLQQAEAKAEADLRALKNQTEYLVRTIRDMDQEIWNMSQRSSWEGMRPHYNKLQEGMIARKHAENNRISDIMRQELINTYTPGPKS